MIPLSLVFELLMSLRNMFTLLVGEAWKGSSVFKTNLEWSILSLFTLFHFYFESHLLAQRNKFSELVNVQYKEKLCCSSVHEPGEMTMGRIKIFITTL